MPGVPLDALAQVKRGLRSLFGRRKKKKQPPQPEPTPSSNDEPTDTTTAAAAAPVEAPTTSKRSIVEAEDATKTEPPPAPPPHPAGAAAIPTPSTATALASDPPPTIFTAPPSSDLPPPHPHISAPVQIDEAKEIDLNPARDIKATEEGDEGRGDGNIISSSASHDLKTAPRADMMKPRTENDTRMSATSGPMGDMAEVWTDSDVGVKEGSPGAGKVEGVEGEGGMF